MNSIRKVWERALMALCFFIGTAVFFLLYMGQIQYKQMKQLCTEFVYEIAKDGIFTDADYYMFLENISELDTGLKVEISHTGYEENPYYSYSYKDDISQYFVFRNIFKDIVLPVEPVIYPEIEPEKLILQEKTNAVVLASLSGDAYVPLPEDGAVSITTCYPVCAEQKVYQGEELCTVIRVVENGLVYYTEADPVKVNFTGTGTYELLRSGQPTGAYVEITSYPRTVVCAYGHETLFTRERIEEYESNGTQGSCSFCALTPVGISAEPEVVSAVVGTPLEDLGITLKIKYQDGHEKTIFAGEEGLYSSYDSSYCGEQEIRFSYLGYEESALRCTLTGGICTLCGSECLNRCKADYDRFSYCDACLEGMPLYMGETYMQKEFTSHDEIVTALAADKVYYFDRGDYVEVNISYSGEWLKTMFFRTVRMPVNEGGTVRTSGKRY